MSKATKNRASQGRLKVRRKQAFHTHCHMNAFAKWNKWSQGKSGVACACCPATSMLYHVVEQYCSIILHFQLILFLLAEICFLPRGYRQQKMGFQSLAAFFVRVPRRWCTLFVFQVWNGPLFVATTEKCSSFENDTHWRSKLSDKRNHGSHNRRWGTWEVCPWHLQREKISSCLLLP